MLVEWHKSGQADAPAKIGMRGAGGSVAGDGEGRGPVASPGDDEGNDGVDV
jgi:hypothetical protein